jgi:hypothetical protein
MLAFAQTTTMVFALRTAAVFVAAGTTRAHRVGLFPRWFTLASYALTLVLLLVTTFFRPVVVLFPAWVAVVSVLVLRRVPVRSGPCSLGPAVRRT